jgi:outer membrane receptor protein involved in Fe transport
LRGSWGTAFRAPSLHQLGLGRTDESPNLVDNVRCNAVGLGCDPQEYTAIFAGNPDLGPEESTSYNLGVIYEITEDLSFSVDYYNYDIENIIDSDTQFVFTNFGGDPNVVTRIPTSDPNDPGEVVQIFDSFQNIGDLETSGLDLDVSYTMETGMGDFRFGYIMNYVLEYEELRPDASGGKRVALTEGQFEQPEIRWTTSVDWSKEDWSATVLFNYIGEFDGDADSGFGDKTVDSMTTVDLTINYTGVENATFTLGSTNLLNEEPPYSHHDFFGFVNTTHSSQGRFVYLRGAYKF